MSLRFACLAAAFSVLVVATAAWWFSSAEGRVRLVAHDVAPLGAGNGEDLAVFDRLEQLQAAYPDRWETLAAGVDFEREKLARVRFDGPGYRTEQIVNGEVQLSETQYGVPAVRSRRGGRFVGFFLDRPTPYLLYGTVHLVFHRCDHEAWYALPQWAEPRLLSKTTTGIDDTLFVLSLFTLGGGAIAVRRRWRTKDRVRHAEVAPKATGGDSDSAPVV